MNLLPIGHSFTVFDTIDSTNMYAMHCIREGMADHGDVFFAHEQTRGKGQRGKKWASAKGQNIQMSVVVKPLQLAASHTFRLSATIALGVHDFLTNLSQEGWHIKWPNDLYRGDRKAGGILIENVFQSDRWEWSIAGVGINLNQQVFDASLPNPTSVSLVTGQNYNPEDAARQLCQALEARWQQLISGQWQQMLDDYNRVLYGAGRQQRLKIGSATGDYTIKKVDSHGQLICGHLGEYHFIFGEVEWILPEN